MKFIHQRLFLLKTPESELSGHYIFKKNSTESPSRPYITLVPSIDGLGEKGGWVRPVYRRPWGAKG